MSRSMPRASGYFHTHYAQDLQLIQTRTERLAALAFVALLIAVPFVASPFLLDLCSQVFLASIGALSLMLLTGYAGQISLGHAGLIAAGAFTTGILAREIHAPFWLTLPAACITGILLGLIFRIAIATSERALSRGQHSRFTFHRYLSRWRIRNQTRLFDWYSDRPAKFVRLEIDRRPGLVLRNARLCCCHLVCVRQFTS